MIQWCLFFIFLSRISAVPGGLPYTVSRCEDGYTITRCNTAFCCTKIENKNTAQQTNPEGIEDKRIIDGPTKCPTGQMHTKAGCRQVSFQSVLERSSDMIKLWFLLFFLSTVSSAPHDTNSDDVSNKTSSSTTRCEDGYTITRCANNFCCTTIEEEKTTLDPSPIEDKTIFIFPTFCPSGQLYTRFGCRPVAIKRTRAR